MTSLPTEEIGAQIKCAMGNKGLKHISDGAYALDMRKARDTVCPVAHCPCFVLNHPLPNGVF